MYPTTVWDAIRHTGAHISVEWLHQHKHEAEHTRFLPSCTDFSDILFFYLIYLVISLGFKIQWLSTPGHSFSATLSVPPEQEPHWRSLASPLGASGKFLKSLLLFVSEVCSHSCFRDPWTALPCPVVSISSSQASHACEMFFGNSVCSASHSQTLWTEKPHCTHCLAPSLAQGEMLGFVSFYTLPATPQHHSDLPVYSTSRLRLCMPKRSILPAIIGYLMSFSSHMKLWE